ncbi:MAG: hypothetical protein MK060_08265 [Blastomonas sp.]|jgi:hypothetical protein|uniref:hypothetical protein n=1 Tax=unclassified Blastomonas TaxID=2626550 RepID=UPI0010F99A02|nr:hypothetical protein [Blastomonas sp.]MCH2237859.1 hypothetical protein [Blastomonas sp.]
MTEQRQDYDSLESYVKIVRQTPRLSDKTVGFRRVRPMAWASVRALQTIAARTGGVQMKRLCVPCVANVPHWLIHKTRPDRMISGRVDSVSP